MDEERWFKKYADLFRIVAMKSDASIYEVVDYCASLGMDTNLYSFTTEKLASNVHTSVYGLVKV